jgi:MATE family multidrug resistance protein
VLALAQSYAYAMLLSAPGVLLLVMLEHFLNGIGRTKLSLMISLIEVPIEILLIYVFVFGKCGLPAFGIVGVGYGLAVSYSATTIILLLYLHRARFAKQFHIFKHVGSFHLAHFKELMRIGLPIGIMYLIEVAAFSMATFFMARFSTVILAAHQIAMQYLGLTINAAYAIAQAVSIRIGQNIGRKDVMGVRYAAYVGIVLSFTLMSCVSLFYIFFPRLLLRIDLNIHDPANASLVKTAVVLIFALAIFQLFDSIRIIASGALRGLKDTHAAMYVSLISFWVIGVVCAYLFGFVLGWQGIGVWVGMTVGVASGAVILIIRLLMKLNKIEAL